MSSQALLVRGGRVLTGPPDRGVFADADVLIENGRISRIEPSIEPGDAEEIDASGQLVMPGLIDTHRHTWQSLLRGICADWTLSDYYAGMRLGVSPTYTAADLELANYYGALDAINCGVTTVLDFSHTNNSPQHAPRAIAGLRASGIRAVFAYGFFDSSPQSSTFSHAERLSDFHRIADEHFTDANDRIVLGVALNETFRVPWEHTVAEVEAARGRGALIVDHTRCVWGSAAGDCVDEMDAHGLLGSDVVHVHGNALTHDQWAAIARHGGHVSISVQTELNMGMGEPAFNACREHGIDPTLSVDIVSLVSGDLWHELRLGLSFARWAGSRHLNESARMPTEVTTTAQEALAWSTVNAANAVQMGNDIGVLEVGRKADLICVGGDSLEQFPRIDPFGTLLFHTSAADVRTVIIDGTLRKLGGELIGVDIADLRRRVTDASEQILQRIADDGRALPGTPAGFREASEPSALANKHAASRVGAPTSTRTVPSSDKGTLS